MTAPETLPERRAALLLLGLPPASRQRVMGKLDDAHSSRLKQLLRELDALGISRSAGRQLQHLASATLPAAPPVASTPTVQEQVEGLNAADVARCMESCASSTVAQLLRAGAWPWKAPVLDRMTEARRAQVVALLSGELPPLAPAVLTALFERLCREVARLHGGAAPADKAPAVGRRAIRWACVRTQLRTRLRRLSRWMR